MQHHQQSLDEVVLRLLADNVVLTRVRLHLSTAWQLATGCIKQFKCCKTLCHSHAL